MEDILKRWSEHVESIQLGVIHPPLEKIPKLRAWSFRVESLGCYPKTISLSAFANLEHLCLFAACLN
ncbi:hypothetical protein JHK85_000857 [Glycine max]|nr:hypothetical protein JHK85_000857 [Glycine max]